MKRKLQVFISSTYEDLREERQAAVEAVLKAGHIPAGMELFTAGSESQMQVIRRWIEESDVFMLILGARYGSIEPNSGLSYVESELEYARELGKPFFSVVLSDEGRELKVKQHGTAVLEKGNEHGYRQLREKVTSNLCAFFTTPQDVKMAVFETLPQFSLTSAAAGWVSAAEIQPASAVSGELVRLSQENQRLRDEIAQLKAKLRDSNTAEPRFEQLVKALIAERVTVPAEVAPHNKPVVTTVLQLALVSSGELARGVSNAVTAGAYERFLMYNIASVLASYGLAEHAKVPANVGWQRIKLSREGISFLTKARVNLAEMKSKAKEEAAERSESNAESSKNVAARATSSRRAATRSPKKVDGGSK